ncbi:hypothetical protein ABIB35_001995 [Arthrobacter sp. UYP6]|uniref:hypothetical protein n=1 Tax=Arthrobacter sp. UYP6 TaxID=1756378 RepID=UPI0033961B70
MQDNSSAFYKRVGALGAVTALAVSGAFIASPAIASPAAEPDTTAPATATTEAPVDQTAAEETVVEETVPDETAPAEEESTLAPGLAEALLRDLGMTVEEFEAAGELGKKAADALPELQATEGFVGIAIDDDTIVITGSGEALEALALELDATLVAPATEEAEVEASEPAAEATEEATDAPSVEAPTASEEPEATEEPASDEGTASPLSLTGDYRANIDKIRADYIANIGVAGLQSIMWNGSGYVISVDKDATLGSSVLSKSLAEVAGSPAEAIAKKYTNVTVADSSGAATPVEDVVNGQGYASPVTNGAALCSIGFNGFNSEGDAAVITAGHCAQDGEVTEALLTDPTGDPASGTDNPSLLAELGTWGFSQFGGPSNAPIPNIPAEYDINNPPEGTGTDIAVIDKINEDLDLLPEVTKWTNAKDLTADAVQVTGTADAIVGAAICKSGRTTGWSCGEVTGVGWFAVGGHNQAADPKDLRGVMGFESTMKGNAAPGDSGGPTVSGTIAVGINSAIGTRGTDELMFSTSLSDGLSHTGGYTVAMFVDAPKLTSHENKATVLTDAAISGSAPAGTAVKLTRNGETTDLDVVDGAWSFTAPSTIPEGGTLEFTVQAVNGFNKSKTSSYELSVKEAPLAAPVITNPGAGAQIADSVKTIKGTGVANAEVTVDITGTSAADTSDSAQATAAVEETGTATIDDKGNWEYKLEDALSYGEYSVAATQDGIAGKSKSPEAASAFKVILNKPVITSVVDGQDFAEGSTPDKISGTGTAGATVNLTVGETPFSALVTDEGSWSVAAPALAPGSYSLRAAQTLSGATSEDTYLVFSVTAVEIAPEAPPVVPGPTPAPQPGDPTPTPTPAPDNNGDGLPDTGVAGMGLFAGAGALLTAGGISALLINRRRQMQDA